MRRAVPLAFALLLVTRGEAHAHPLGFAVVSIRETSPRAAEAVVRISGTESDPGRIALRWPSDCVETVQFDAMDDEVRERRSIVRCDRALAGRTLHVDGPARGLELRIESRSTRAVLHALPADVVLGASASSLDVARAQAALGAEHFAGGLDHVLFVVGAFFLARKQGARAVALAVTAFTVGHAITLALASCGGLAIATRPVEACIALSLVHVARELAIDRDTITRRIPALACFVFGLVHGAGLASVMQGAGLHGLDLGVAVGAFNVGLELAELALVLALFALVRGRTVAPLSRLAPLVVGGVGVWLLLDRLG